MKIKHANFYRLFTLCYSSKMPFFKVRRLEHLILKSYPFLKNQYKHNQNSYKPPYRKGFECSK